MKASHTLIALLVAAPIVGVSPASAADGNAEKIQVLEQQLTALQQELAALKESESSAATEAKAQVDAVKSQLAAAEKARTSAVTASLQGGRPTLSSADGSFSVSLRGALQADFGYYMQSSKAVGLSNGPDMSSGVNIRRAQLGLEGKVFDVWSYKFNYEFGGSGYETPGKILNAYLEYDGLKPFAVRIGAFAPSYSIEDQTAATQVMFLERSTPVNMLRNVAGSEGRVGISAVYAGPRLFGAVSFTMGKIAESGNYDEQEALVGRLGYLLINDKENDAHLYAGANIVHTLSLPDLLASGASGTPSHTLTLSDYPEITVDDTTSKLLSTGALVADGVTFWGLEAAGNYRNFYLEGAYNGIHVNRAGDYTVYSASGVSADETVKVKNNSLSAWYVQTSWVLTGESKPYLPATAAFGSPKPAKPFSIDDGTWGAWEVAGRYSDTNLNDRLSDASSVITAWSGTSKTYTFYNAVRGGEQRIYTLGLNWYPNSVVRISLDYLWIDVDRVSATSSSGALPTKAIGQSLQAVALRTQLAF